MEREIKEGFADRLRDLAYALHFKSVFAFTTELGFSNSYFRNVGRVNNEAAMRILKKYPNVNIDYVNYGTGSVFTKEKVIEANNVPLIPVAAQGGVLTDFETCVTEIDCETIACPIKNATMAIAVSGDSMSPEFPSGSIVYISKVNEKAFIEWGKTYVLDTENGIVIKNVLPDTKNEENIVCRSINPNYNDFIVEKRYIRGWYRVKGTFMLK